MNNIGSLPPINRFSTDTPTERRSTWSQEEDARLLQLVSVYGPKSWCAIAKEMKTRNGKSCRSRWFNYLAPGIKKGAFTAEEEQRIIERQRQFGNRWSAIAEYLPGRTDMAIKNYWNGHLKRKLAMQQGHQEMDDKQGMEHPNRLEALVKDCPSGSSEAMSHCMEDKQVNGINAVNNNAHINVNGHFGGNSGPVGGTLPSGTNEPMGAGTSGLNVMNSSIIQPIAKRAKTDAASFSQLQSLGVLQDCKTLPFVVALAAILIELCDEKDPQMLCNVLEIANQIRSLKKANRRKLTKDWLTQLKTLQKRSDRAFKDLPFAFALQFTKTEDGNVEYLTAQRIRDQQAETSERGYFGGLSGNAGLWDKIIKTYERSNLQLGEAGQRIVQIVDFDVPFLKKQMESLDKKIVELNRMKAEGENNALSATNAFLRECHELGIDSTDDLESEIYRVGNRIYKILESGCEKIRMEETKTVLLFYRSMNVNFHATGGDALRALESVMSETVEMPDPELMKNSRKLSETQDKSGASAQVVAMEHAEEGNVGEVEINWDLPEIETTEIHVEENEWKQDGDADDGIDWNFEVEIENVKMEETTAASLTWAVDSRQDKTGANQHHEDGNKDREESQLAAMVLRFVWDKDFRNQFLDDLYELQAFLRVRSVADLADTVLLNFSDVLFKFDHSQIQSYVNHIDEIVDAFAGDSAQKYLLLKTSHTYEQHLLEDLKKKANKPKEWKKVAMKAEQEKSVIQTELSQTLIRIGQLSRQVKDLKDLVEKGISPLFDNRQINVMGKINTLIQSHVKD